MFIFIMIAPQSQNWSGTLGSYKHTVISLHDTMLEDHGDGIRFWWSVSLISQNFERKNMVVL